MDNVLRAQCERTNFGCSIPIIFVSQSLFVTLLTFENLSDGATQNYRVESSSFPSSSSMLSVVAGKTRSRALMRSNTVKLPISTEEVYMAFSKPPRLSNIRCRDEIQKFEQEGLDPLNFCRDFNLLLPGDGIRRWDKVFTAPGVNSSNRIKEKL